MPTPPDFTGASDRALLRQYVSWVHAFLKELVEADRSPNDPDLFAQELIGPMREAWAEVQPAFQHVIGAAGEIPPEQMERHGLIGAQLRFKLATVTWRWNLFHRRKSTPLFRRLLNSIDTLLNSILSAIPGGASAVSEMKDAIRDASKGPEES